MVRLLLLQQVFTDIHEASKVNCVLLALWMMACFHIMGHMARSIGNNDVGAILKQVVKISNVCARGATLFNFVAIYNDNKWHTGGQD